MAAGDFALFGILEGGEINDFQLLIHHLFDYGLALENQLQSFRSEIILPASHIPEPIPLPRPELLVEPRSLLAEPRAVDVLLLPVHQRKADEVFPLLDKGRQEVHLRFVIY